MKMRSGFVSNSSSSSYIILTTKETYDKVLKKLSELEREAVKAEFDFEKEKAFGKDMIVCCREISTEDLGSEWEFIPEDKDGNQDDNAFNEAYHGLDKFVELINKEKDSYAKNF